MAFSSFSVLKKSSFKMAIFLKIVILNDDKKKRILTILEKSGPKLSLETIEFIDFCVDISIKK